MILEFLGDNLDGDAWETLINECYREKYKEQGYQELPAGYRGDGGIEGFTYTGIVYQCYCPDKELLENGELHSKYVDKMTTDINKFIDRSYGEKLKSFGVPAVKEWHLVVPEYRDTRIIVHAKTKTDLVLATRASDPDFYTYIAEDFKILVKVAKDFRVELTRLLRNKFTDTKINLAIVNHDDVDWEKCDSEKVKNIKRKVRAVMQNVDEDDPIYKRMVQRYISYYMAGIEILSNLRVDLPEVYEDLHELELAYKKNVEAKTMMNVNKEINGKIFTEILDDFEKKLKEDCDYLSYPSIEELKQDMVGGWLADCSMEFRG